MKLIQASKSLFIVGALSLGLAQIASAQREGTPAEGECNPDDFFFDGADDFCKGQNNNSGNTGDYSNSGSTGPNGGRPGNFQVEAGEQKCFDSIKVTNLSTEATGHQNVNVRSEPGVQGAKVGQIPGYGVASVLGFTAQGGVVNDPDLRRTSSEWYQVDYQGLSGWISALYAECTEGTGSVIIDEGNCPPDDFFCEENSNTGDNSGDNIGGNTVDCADGDFFCEDDEDFILITD